MTNLDFVYATLVIKIKILNSIERDLIDILCNIEEYLPYDKRYFLHRRKNRYSQEILNRKTYEGYVPSELFKGQYCDFEDELCVDLERKKLLKYLKAKLSVRQYQVIVLYYFCNLIQEDIAKILDISQPSVTTYLEDGINKLKNDKFFIDFLKFLCK